LSVVEMSIYWAFRLRSTPSNNTRSLGVSSSLNAQSNICSLSVVEMSIYWAFRLRSTPKAVFAT
ncbi:MAG: hypothetical protein LC120_06790, partial [Bacteroidales bacterium]|nr:hypothetical protein [Bacteroidales bacterium]